MNLTTWLRQTPQPTSIRADGTPVSIPNGGRKWSNLAATLDSMAATKVECLDSHGSVIRATNLDVDAMPVAETPIGELTDVQVFAKLLAEAYEKGTKSYAPLLDAAMQFVEAQSQRLAKAEAENERLRVLNAKLRVDAAAGKAGTADGLGGLGELIGPMVAGLLQAQAAAAEPPAPPPQPNGVRTKGAT